LSAGPAGRTLRRFLGQRMAVASLVLLLLMAAACFSTLGWSKSAMRAQRLTEQRQPPSWQHPLGTDELGRSLLARTLFGGAVSLGLGLLAAGVAVGIGTTYGAVSGFFGGRLDGLMMRLVDVLYALPSLLLVMLLTVSLGAWLEGPSRSSPEAHSTPGVLALGPEWARLIVLAIGIGGVSWLTVARVVRGQVLLIREQAYIEACRALGLPAWRTLLFHILPNLVGPIILFSALTIPQAILQESFLSFLGVGVQPPQATWGSLAADGVRALNPLALDWWLVLVPCLTLALTLLALNFTGEGLRNALDSS
jgi:oligopeptide transport system permease protein